MCDAEWASPEESLQEWRSLTLPPSFASLREAADLGAFGAWREDVLALIDAVETQILIDILVKTHSTDFDRLTLLFTRYRMALRRVGQR